MTATSSLDPLFRITLFGSVTLFIGGKPFPLSPFQKGLVGILYGNDRESLARNEIINLFWPDADLVRARKCLNQLLYSFKKKTGPHTPYQSTRDQVRCVPLRGGSDLESFFADLETDRFDSCVTLLASGFLPELVGTISNSLSSWIEQRERAFRDLLGLRIREVLREREVRGDWAGTHDTAAALARLHPLDETCLRTLMKARANDAGPQEAEATYEEFLSRKRAAIGQDWTPGRETKVLLERIRSLEVIDPPDLGAGRPQQDDEPRLIGRDSEHVLLRRTLARVPHQALRGILVQGEAGIGKTRLIRESVHGLSLDGQYVFSTDQAELEQLIPMNPLIEALRDPRVGEALIRLDEPWRAVLFGVMPNHHQGRGPIPQAPQIRPGSVPRRLFEAFYQLLLRLVEEAPVTLVIEDLQWADETTLSILEFLFRRWDHGSLQAVFSIRSEEVRGSSALKSFLDTLRVHEDFLEVPLTDLKQPSAKALIQDISSKHLTEAELSHLYSLAGGNPFFLIELTLEYLAGRVDQPTLPEGILSIPLSIRQVLDRRLSHLSLAAEKALGALSVYGRGLRVEDLAKIADLSISECMNGLDQLHEFRLVRSDRTTVSVGHELIRQTVYQGLSATRRGWLHKRIAGHIQETNSNPPPDELAIHFHHAGVAEKALRFAEEAEKRAEASGAIPEALRFLTIARKHTTDPEKAADIVGQMGHLNYLHQNLEQAAPLLEVAAQRYRRQGRDGEALEVELERVDSLGQTGRLPLRECLEELESIKQEARERESWETFMKALDVASHLFDRSADLSAVQAVFEEARRFGGEGDAKARCQAKSVLALNVYYGCPREGLAAAREAVRIASSLGNRDLELHALNRLILVLLYQGRLHTPEGKRAFAEAEERFASSGDLIRKFFVKLNRVVWHLEVGELDRAAAALPAAEAVIRGTQTEHLWARFLLNRGELELEANQIAEAQESFSEALSLLSDSSPQYFRTIITSGLGLCALREGSLREAKRLEAELPNLPANWTFDPSVVATFTAEMYRLRGNHGGAVTLLEELATQVRKRFVTGWLKLNIHRTKILRRSDPQQSSRLAVATLNVAEGLGLERRSEELRRLVE